MSMEEAMEGIVVIRELDLNNDTPSVKEIGGVIRGCIKIVTCGKKLLRNNKGVENPTGEYFDPKLVPVCRKVAYILGLRISHSPRRRGIGLKLVN
ncbi:hypothetical protein ACFX2I_003354 [Malus domestica]